MALTNRQIERYSRQIIVPNFGGVAQERLLESRILLIADTARAESVLAYLVGAGVGRIDLRTAIGVSARDAMLARMRDLNPDSIVRIAENVDGEFDVVLAIVGDGATLDEVRALCDRPANLAIVLARVDDPARIAVLPVRPPCPRCADAGELLAPVGACAGNAGFVANLAALEAIKLLARFAPAPKPTLVEFCGYESSARVPGSMGRSSCGCASTLAPEGPR